MRFLLFRSLLALSAIPCKKPPSYIASPVSLFKRSGSHLSSRAVSSQVFSTLMSLTSVFGMGTGVASSPSAPVSFLRCNLKIEQRSCVHFRRPHNIWSSPRPISTHKLHASRRFHFRPINLIVFEGSYLVNPVGYLILRPASRLDAFSVYPFRT